MVIRRKLKRQNVLAALNRIGGLGLETIDPCLPSAWKGFTVSRRYRGAVYNITVDNSAGAEYGVKEITVNGKTQAGTVIPPAPAGETFEVKVVMG